MPVRRLGPATSGDRSGAGGGACETGTREAEVEAMARPLRKLIVAAALAGALVWAAGAGGLSAFAQPGVVGSESVAQAEEPSAQTPSSLDKSDSEVRVVLAVLIGVAAVALLGTFVYWVRTGDSSPTSSCHPADRSDDEGTLG